MLITAGVIVLIDVGVTLAWGGASVVALRRNPAGASRGELDDLETSFLTERSLPDVQA